MTVYVAVEKLPDGGVIIIGVYTQEADAKKNAPPTKVGAYDVRKYVVQ